MVLVMISILLMSVGMFMGPIIPAIVIKGFKFDILGIGLMAVSTILWIIVSVTFSKIIMSSPDYSDHRFKTGLK